MKKYHFFWGGIYSNWYKSKFTVNIYGEDMTFNCGEQYMMFMKATLMDDPDTAEKVMRTSNPREQKKLGRYIPNFDTKLWEEKRYLIMLKGLMCKFTQDQELLEQLLQEDCDEFVEASPYDRIWGIGYDAKNALDNIQDWGENLLGKIITEIRNTLR